LPETTAIPRVGIPFLEPSGLPDEVQAAGGEPVPLRLPPERPEGGVALVREWISDLTGISCAGYGLDALLLAADRPEELMGMLAAAARLNLPAVCAAPRETDYSVALAALGATPLSASAAEAAVAVGRSGAPGARDIIENFSLANALRAGLCAGGDPELLVHLAAIAREAGVVGFPRMIRVLAPETAVLDARDLSRFADDPTALISGLGEALHDVPTVEGRLKEHLPEAPALPSGVLRTAFVRGRASGTEAVCQAPPGVHEVSGECRVFDSEDAAARAVAEGELPGPSILVLTGRGPRGSSGLSRPDRLERALRENGANEIAVFTDGLPPRVPQNVWFSLVTPEAAAGGIIGRLRDGDTLRIDLDEGRIRTGVRVEKLAGRELRGPSVTAARGYVARYARTALPAMEGAGFG